MSTALLFEHHADGLGRDRHWPANERDHELTLASVLVLPGALIAGVLGMNFRLGVFDTTPTSGWSWP